MWGKNNENSIEWKCEMFSFRFYCKALPDYYLRRNLLLFLNANLPLDALCPFVPVLSLSITIERFLADIYSWNIFSQTDWYLSDLLCQVKKKQNKQTLYYVILSFYFLLLKINSVSMIILNVLLFTYLNWICPLLYISCEWHILYIRICPLHCL